MVESVLDSVSSNDNTNDNTNDSDTEVDSDTDVDSNTDVDVDVDFALDSLPDDADLVDIDMSDGASMGDVFAAGNNLDYDPGNDLGIDHILGGALDGKGNDVGQSFIGSNNLVDNDSVENVHLANNNAFTATAQGGSATADEGIEVEAEGSAETDPYADAEADGEADLDVEDGGELELDFLAPLDGVSMRNAGPEGQEHGEGGHHGQGGQGGQGGAQGDLDGNVDGGIDGTIDVAGTADGYSTLGDWASGNGRDGSVDGTSLSDADATLNVSAFNQSFVLGANVLGNSVDTTVVGGNMSMDYAMDDSTS